MRLIALLCAVCCLVACTDQKPPEAVPVKRSYSYPDTSSDWLNTSGRLYTERRAVSLDGVDIRSACYLLNADNLDLLIHLRNYDARFKGLPDHQWLVQADVFNRQVSDPALPADQLPLRLLPFPGHDQALLQTVRLEPDGSVRDQGAALQLLDPAGTVSPIEGAESLYPVTIDGEGLIHCWQQSALQLDRGLLYSSRDYAAGLQLLDSAGQAADSPLQWLSINADPVSPAHSTVSYLMDLPGNNLPQDVEWKFPYHMSYSAESWLPPLLNLSGNRIATLLFQPDATGPSSRANYNGIFRLATLDPQDGSIHLLEEDMPPRLNILLQDDVLFFCRPTNGESTVRWEIWASDPSGLHKRRLYYSDDSVYLNLADLTAGRLLFFRQFFAREDSQPVLYSELLEVSTEGLGKGIVNLERRLAGTVDSPSGIPPINF